MLTGSNVLDHIVISRVAAAGVYWHVGSTKHDLAAGNPHSTGRLAWRDGLHAMFYAGSTPAAALWESVLREAEIDSNGYVYTEPSHLQDKVLVRLKLTVDVHALDLRTPHRRRIVKPGSTLDVIWDNVLKEPIHGETHEMTTRVMAQLAAAGETRVPTLLWHSRQSGSDTSTLFFQPPMEIDWWLYGPSDVFPLDGPGGDAQISIALAAQGLKWRGAPSGPGFDPPVGVT